MHNEDADEKAARDKKNDEELAAAQAEERARHEKREAEIAASWSKRVVVEGTGATAYKGAQAKVHVVGRATVDKHVQGRARERGFVSGSVFEDSRARGCPLMLLLGRGTLVPGLDRALLEMRVGEQAEVTVAPEGGYGAAGSVDHPCVPGSATLRYDVELLSLDKEEELWDMDFPTKMRLATERRQRGNTLVGTGHMLMADAEYEQALRYLVFMPHPQPHEVASIQESLAAVYLNLAATRLRLNDEHGAIRYAQDALKACEPDTSPCPDAARASKAHYRLGQARTQLGQYADATRHFDRAVALAGSDSAAVAAIEKERARLTKRQEKHARDRKRAATRMVQGGAGEEEEEGGAADGAGGRFIGRWMQAARGASLASQAALAMLGAALLVAMLAGLAQAFMSRPQAQSATAHDVA